MAKRPASLTTRTTTRPRPWVQSARKSRHARGYGWEWEKTRTRIMERDRRLCQACLRQGRVQVASDVDHIVPRSQGGGEGDGNLQALCHPCHKAKTAGEGQARHGE